MLISTRGCALAAVALAALLASAPAWADAAVNGSRRTEMLDCDGADAVVNGDANRLVFHGYCRSLHINGTGNAVEIDLIPGGSVNVAGDGNHVLYTPVEPGPVVATQGNDNLVGAGSGGLATAALAPPIPDAPPPPVAIPPAEVSPAATLVLDGEGQSRDITCAGQNVLIRGSAGRFVLRGGCRSVTVQGRADSIQAELQPGAHVAIGGDAVTLNYTLTSNGPPPVVSVSGANSGVTQTSSTSGPVVVSQPGGTTVIGTTP